MFLAKQHAKHYFHITENNIPTFYLKLIDKVSDLLRKWLTNTTLQEKNKYAHIIIPLRKTVNPVKALRYKLIS